MDDKDFLKVFLSDVLEKYVVQQRWYAGKASKLKYIELQEYFRIQQHGEVYYGLLLEVNFEEAFFQHYFPSPLSPMRALRRKTVSCPWQ